MWPVCNNGITVLPATHTQTIPAFTPQGITALWLVLIVPNHEGMARLSWSGGWLHTKINVPHRELNLDMVTRRSINWARRRLTLLIETLCQTNALSTCHRLSGVLSHQWKTFKSKPVLA